MAPPYIHSPLPGPSGVRQLFDDPMPLSEDSWDFWAELLTALPISACLESSHSVAFRSPLSSPTHSHPTTGTYKCPTPFLFILHQRLQTSLAVTVLPRVNPPSLPTLSTWVFGPQTLAAYATTVLPLVLLSPSLEPSTPLVQGIACITVSLPPASARRQPCRVPCVK